MIKAASYREALQAAIEPSFFIAFMSHPAMRIGAGLLIALGVIALTIGTCGILAPALLSLTSTVTIALLATGGSAVLTGSGLFTTGFFAKRAAEQGDSYQAAVQLQA